MAAKNRDGLTTDLTALTPTVDWGTLTAKDLQAYISTVIESVVLNRDYSNSATATTSTYAVDYTGYDYFVLTLNTGGSCEISFTNIAQGEVKWFKIDNTNLESWTYSGVTDETKSQGTLENLTSIIYKVYNKDGTLHIIPMVNDLDASTNSTTQTGTSTSSYTTPANVKYVVRQGYYSLSNAENYNVADGVGLIEIPSGVTGGTINLPTAASFAGHRIKIYSTGGSGVSVESTSVLVGSFTANYVYEAVCNGSSWTTVMEQSRV